MKRPSNMALAISLSMDNNDAAINPLPSKRRRLDVDSEWILRELPEMPYLYLKEKTATVVLNENAQHIANRIVESAQSMNCFGEYNCEKAKAILSVDNTEFYIQLFKVRVTEKNQKTNACIIVEMQRLSGSALVFHKVARNILSASKNANVETISSAETPRTSSSTKRYAKSNREGSNNSSVKESDLFERTMEIVDCLLKKDRVDANLLGLESLQLLTNPKSSSDAMVAYASKVALMGCDFMDVKMSLFAIIANHDMIHEGEPLEDDSVEAKYCNKIHTCALAILANSLDAMTGPVDFEEQYLIDDEWAGEDGFLSVLLNEMDGAKDNPHDAYLAALSVEYIVKNSLRMKSKVAELGAVRIILDAHTVGKGYPLLSKVSTSLLEILGETK